MKIILKFVQFEDDWQEIFYGLSDSPQQMLASLDASFLSSAIVFRQQATYLAAVKVQDTTQPRSAVTTRITPLAPISSPALADVRNACAIWTLSSAGNVANRKLFVRGVRDTDLSRNPVTGAPDFGGNLVNGMANYIANMKRLNLQIRQLVPITTTDPYQWYDITQITVAAGGVVTLTTRATVPLGPTGRIIISQFDPKMWPGLNGHYSTKSVAAPNFSVSYRSDLPAGVYVITKGRYRVEEYRYQAIDLQTPSGASTYTALGSRLTKSGPFGGRGAKRAVRLRSR